MKSNVYVALGYEWDLEKHKRLTWWRELLHPAVVQSIVYSLSTWFSAPLRTACGACVTLCPHCAHYMTAAASRKPPALSAALSLSPRLSLLSSLLSPVPVFLMVAPSMIALSSRIQCPLNTRFVCSSECRACCVYPVNPVNVKSCILNVLI